MYADIAVCLPLVRTFVYKLSESVETGCRVVVPFRKRDIEGFVVGLRKDAPRDLDVHDIRSVVDRSSLLRPDIFELCRWIAEYYVSPLGEVLKAALPPGITAKHIEKHSPPRRGGVDATSIKISRSLLILGADGVVSSAEKFRRSDHPVCAQRGCFATSY